MNLELKESKLNLFLGGFKPPIKKARGITDLLSKNNIFFLILGFMNACKSCEGLPKGIKVI